MPARGGLQEGDTMVSSGKTPWHTLGARSDRLMTPKEALLKAGLDWEVVKMPLLVDHGDGNMNYLQDWVATVRASDGLPLGAVKPSYPIINNDELLEFLMAVIKVLGAGDRLIETAGSLFNARVVWFLVHLPLDIDLGLGGNVESYVVIASSHNATMKPTLKNTPTRVECANTLDMAIAGVGGMFGFKHQLGWKAYVPQAQEALGVTRAYLEAFEKKAREMMSAKVTRKTIDAYLENLFPGKVDDTGNVPVKVQHRRDAVVALLSADNLQNVKLSKWALYNATADYIDHQGIFRETDNASRDDNRAYSILTGSASQLKARALHILSEV